MYSKYLLPKTNKWLVVLMVVLLSACNKKTTLNDQEKKALNIGHAGMGFNSLINPFNPLPDNSMASIKRAMDLGADGVEVDVQLTSDSVLVLYHDKKLESKTAKKGCISEMHSEEVIGTPFKVGFPFDQFQDESIIGLAQLFEEFSKRDTFPWIYLDIHSHNYCNLLKGYAQTAMFARALARLIEKSKVPEHKIQSTSTYYKMLLEIRKANPRLKLLFEEDTDFEKGMRILKKYQFDGLVLKRKLFPGVEAVRKAKQEGIHVVFFGGKSKSSIREMLAFEPDALQVNNVEVLKVLKDE
jgi:glycerophosphoryl diester phosphodiesterase